MKVLVFSDVHGNLPAFRKMLADAGQVDRHICLGDVVGYGPWSNECVDLVYTLENLTYLEGNHEKDFLCGRYSGSSEVAKKFFDFTYPFFDRHIKIKNLNKECVLNGFVFTHTIESRNIYSNSEIILKKNYVIGHSHHQFRLQQGDFFLYNTGSVGQNREYINIINYIIYDTDRNDFEMRKVVYDVEQVINEMKIRKYPIDCISYYKNKKIYESEG